MFTSVASSTMPARFSLRSCVSLSYAVFPLSRMLCRKLFSFDSLRILCKNDRAPSILSSRARVSSENMSASPIWNGARGVSPNGLRCIFLSVALAGGLGHVVGGDAGVVLGGKGKSPGRSSGRSGYSGWSSSSGSASGSGSGSGSGAGGSASGSVSGSGSGSGSLSASGARSSAISSMATGLPIRAGCAGARKSKSNTISVRLPFAV